ncbi:hypothetical protein ABBQ32_007543 [Trebouxia sp. C0010 RCD-2024]
MQAAMLLLGRTFPLRKCLSRHILVDIIQETHLTLQLELKKPRPQDTDLQTQNTEPATQQSKHADNGNTQNCARCRKRLWREEDIIFTSDQVRMQFYAENNVCRSCSKCHAAAYCSYDCMRLGRADHKAMCKQQQLRNKLAAR